MFCAAILVAQEAVCQYSYIKLLRICALSLYMPLAQFVGKPSSKVTYLKWNTPEGMETGTRAHNTISIRAHEIHDFSKTAHDNEISH